MGIKHILMPNLGESVTEATVVEWLVKPGDKVEKYDVLLEAQSDKVITEIPSEFEGVIQELLIEANDTVPIGTQLLTMEVEGASGEAVPEAETAAPKEAIQESFISEPEETQNEESAKQSKAESGAKARYSPAVVRIAQEKGIDLKEVTGTGKEGRITRKDILNFKPETAKKVEAAPSQKAISEQPVAAPSSSSSAEDKTPVYEGDERQHVVPADGVRRAIAKNMVRSSNEVPHAWLMVEADVTNIVNLRNQMKHEFKKQEGVSLSFFPFFVKAVAQALKKNPLLNSSWDNGNIIYNKDINISIAVATEDHLYVPVIKHADQFSITGIAKEIDRLAGAARSGKLKTQDMQGGTITVNNTGTFGSVQSMGIINYPQAAILQVESIQERFVPAEGGFKAAHMVNLCLSIDHRLLDGLQAGRFMKDVKENLSLYNDEANIY